MKYEVMKSVDGREFRVPIPETAAERAQLALLPRAPAGVGRSSDNAEPDEVDEDNFIEDDDGEYVTIG